MVTHRTRPPREASSSKQLRHLQHRVHELEERLTMTAADLTAALAALKQTVDNLPASAPALIDQATLDAAVQSVTDTTAELKAKTAPAV